MQFLKPSYKVLKKNNFITIILHSQKCLVAYKQSVLKWYKKPYLQKNNFKGCNKLCVKF